MKSLLKRLYSLASHPSASKRLGAALAFNNIYTVFRCVCVYVVYVYVCVCVYVCTLCTCVCVCVGGCEVKVCTHAHVCAFVHALHTQVYVCDRVSGTHVCYVCILQGGGVSG